MTAISSAGSVSPGIIGNAANDHGGAAVRGPPPRGWPPTPCPPRPRPSSTQSARLRLGRRHDLLDGHQAPVDAAPPAAARWLALAVTARRTPTPSITLSHGTTGRPRESRGRARRTRPPRHDEGTVRSGDERPASALAGGRRRADRGRLRRVPVRTPGTAARAAAGRAPGQGPRLEINRRENQDRDQAGRRRTPRPGAPLSFSLRSTHAFQLLPAAVSLPVNLIVAMSR